MPWKKEWAWEDADKSTKHKKHKRGKYTELDMFPWVCAQAANPFEKNQKDKATDPYRTGPGLGYPLSAAATRG